MLAFLYYAGDNSTYSNQEWARNFSKGAINESIQFAKRIFHDVLFEKYLYFQSESDAKREAELFARKQIYDVNRHGQIDYDFPKGAFTY